MHAMFITASRNLESTKLVIQTKRPTNSDPIFLQLLATGRDGTEDLRGKHGTIVGVDSNIFPVFERLGSHRDRDLSCGINAIHGNCLLKGAQILAVNAGYGHLRKCINLCVVTVAAQRLLIVKEIDNLHSRVTHWRRSENVFTFLAVSRLT